MGPNDRFISLVDIEIPIVQAPMAGSAFSDMVIAFRKLEGSVRLLVHC